MDTKPKTKPELRKFGLTIGIAFAVLGGVLFWRGKPFWVYLEVVAAAFILSGLLLPQILRPVERIWMKAARQQTIRCSDIVSTRGMSKL